MDNPLPVNEPFKEVAWELMIIHFKIEKLCACEQALLARLHDRRLQLLNRNALATCSPSKETSGAG